MVQQTFSILKTLIQFYFYIFNIHVLAEQQQYFYICTHVVQLLEPSAQPISPFPFDPRWAAVIY